MRPGAGLRVLAIAVVVAAALARPAAAAPTPLEQRAEHQLHMTCSHVTTSDGVTYAKCTGEIPTFDGIGIDTDLSIPVGATRPLPTILLLHGWSGDKTDWETDTKAGDGKDTWHWNNVWFASQGWVAVNTTARGFKESCGQTDGDANCGDGYTHLADRPFETRDSQTILGKLVDAGIAAPGKLAASGGSYGGGQSWLLAASLPWASPKGATLQLAAAVPKYPWTDLLDSLAPNGRATPDPNQSESSHLAPFGIAKESYVDGLYAAGRAVGDGRYDTDPQHFGTNLDEQYARLQQGEPYDPSTDPRLKAVQDSYLSRSPFFADQYFTAVQNHTVKPVPVLSIQGWTDPLFPAVQTLQMFRRLKAADPAYPITMVFGDVGHSNAQNPSWQWQPINTLDNGFLDARVLGRSNELPAAQAYSFQTECASSDQPAPVSGQWDGLTTGTVVVQGSGTQTTSSADPNPSDGPATDPITHRGCLTEGSGTTDPQGAYWTFPSNGIHVLGLPKVDVAYSMSGQDAAIAFKLWDVAPDGSKTLVTRGDYRLRTADGDPSQGTLSTYLYGNDWVFPSGHQIQLQITQNDGPYLRPDTLPSTIDFTAPRITFPVR